MSDDQDKEKDSSSGFVWEAPEDGICEVYSNVVHVNWSAYDIRIRFGQMLPAGESKEYPTGSKWVVEEGAAVTMAYGEAKYLRNLLHTIIKDYEAKNGEIKVSPIWPAPTETIEPT